MQRKLALAGHALPRVARWCIKQLSSRSVPGERSVDFALDRYRVHLEAGGRDVGGTDHLRPAEDSRLAIGLARDGNPADRKAACEVHRQPVADE